MTSIAHAKFSHAHTSLWRRPRGSKHVIMYFLKVSACDTEQPGGQVASTRIIQTPALQHLVVLFQGANFSTILSTSGCACPSDMPSIARMTTRILEQFSRSEDDLENGILMLPMISFTCLGVTTEAFQRRISMYCGARYSCMR